MAGYDRQESIQKMKNKKSKVGSTPIGAKIGFFLGFIISTTLNIGGFSNLIDNFFEWYGIFERVFNIYDRYVIYYIELITEPMVGWLFEDPRVHKYTSIYISISTSTLMMYFFAAKLINIEGSGVLSTKSARFASPINVIREAHSKSGFKGPQGNLSAKQKILLIFTKYAIVAPLFAIGFSVYIVVITPLYILKSTLISIWSYFFVDFDGDDHTEAKLSYNAIFAFWFCVIFTLIGLGLALKLNDTLQDKCTSGEIDAYHWICTR